MPTTIGPRFAIWGTAPQQWNTTLAEDSMELAVCVSNNGHGVSLESTDPVAGLGSEGVLIQVVSQTLRQKLIDTQKPCWMFLAQLLREDGEQLFAFESPAQRNLFLELIKIESVGPKLAAQILAHVSVSDLQMMAVQGKPITGLKVSGLGPKKLEALAHGLKVNHDRFSLILNSLNSGESAPRAKIVGVSHAAHDVLRALEKMGMGAQEGQQLLDQLERDGVSWQTLSSPILMRELLRLKARMLSRSDDARSEDASEKTNKGSLRS